MGCGPNIRQGDGVIGGTGKLLVWGFMGMAATTSRDVVTVLDNFNINYEIVDDFGIEGFEDAEALYLPARKVILFKSKFISTGGRKFYNNTCHELAHYFRDQMGEFELGRFEEAVAVYSIEAVGRLLNLNTSI